MSDKNLKNIDIVNGVVEEQQCLFKELPKQQAKQKRLQDKIEKKAKKKAEKEIRKNELKKRKALKGFDESDVVYYPNNDSWFKLDNAATIYPAVVSEKWMFVYRLSAVLIKPVDPKILQQAVNDILPRFPTFNVSIRRGVFWYYFERRNVSVKVEREHTFPCQPFEFGSGKNLIRFLYYGNRISFECFHALADGRSSLLLFNTLLHRYFELCGEKISNFDGCLDWRDFPKEEEAEDSFFEYCGHNKKNNMKEKKAYKIKGTDEDNTVVNTINIIMNVENVKNVAKSYNTGIYVFLCSVMTYSLLNRHKNAKNPVKISVPIDLRSFFESETLRNFSSYINVPVESKVNLKLEDVINIYKHEFEKINKDYLLGNINANTALQKNVLIKSLPLFIKDFVMKICFKLLGEDYQTLAFSNIGVVKTPPEFLNLIDRYEVNLGKNKYNNKSAGAISFNGKMVVTISSKIRENIFERDFVRMLSKLGVETTVESNRRDMYAR